MSSDNYEYGEYETVILALTRILSNKYKRDVRITSFLREELRNWRRSIVSRLYLQLDSCDETTVIVKQKNPDEFGMPDWYGATGEDFIVAQEALGRILSGKRIAPELYGTVCDVEKRRYWLFMEDIGENLVRFDNWENEEMKHCLSFVEKLAEIHLLFADKDEELQVLGGLRGTRHHSSNWIKNLDLNRDLVFRTITSAHWRYRCESALEKAPDNIDKIVQTGKFPWLNEMATDFAAIMEPCRAIIDSLVSQPFVSTHGDKSPGENMIISREGKEPIYYFLDWEDLSFGPVLDDLADFLGYGREATEELALVERYWKCVQGSPLVSSEKEEYLMMYKYYRLMRSIRHVHTQSEFFIKSQFGEYEVAREREIRWALPVAIKLAKELQMM